MLLKEDLDLAQAKVVLIIKEVEVLVEEEAEAAFTIEMTEVI